MSGYTVNGSFAEYALGEADYLGRIPDGLSFIDAAPILCAGVTTYKGLKQTQARPGEWVVISGVGGLGHVAVQYAKAMGLHVAAIDIGPEKLALARKLGADVKVCPCKTMVPLYRNHVFGQIKPTTRTRIDLGFALGDFAATGRLIDTGGFAKKDRITHRIPITTLEDIDDEVCRYLKMAYDRDA